MVLITVASYYASGSSAVTDFLSEFDNVKSLTDYEFRFAHDPDGLSELEYNLVENFNRHNSGHALKRYRNLVDYYSDHFLVKRYEPFFQNRWKKESYSYIESLVDFSYPGCWQYDFYDKGPWYEFWHKLPERILKRTIWKNNPDKHLYFEKDVTYASHPSEEKFLDCTRKYTDALMNLANAEQLPYMVVDQILPSSNIARHMRYFNNIKTFVVDRDPRDVYLLAKYEWNDTIVPKDLELFCQWYAYNRSTKHIEQMSASSIMFVQFEDLIYRYEETTIKIMDWLGLDRKNHTHPLKCLNPHKSIKNTKYWEQHPEFADEANYIAEMLPQFLYQYEG